MRQISFLIGAFLLSIMLLGFRSTTPRILVFSKTAAFRHSAIGVGKLALLKMGQQKHWIVDTTEDASVFTEEVLERYDAVVFLHTTGDVLNDTQAKAFEHYIQHGGGFAGIHAASDTEYDWPWYGALVGGYFLNHPKQQDAILNVTDATHVSTQHLPAVWKRWDEWYNFKQLDPAIHVLMTIDETSYSGGKNGSEHPMAWYHNFDGGKAWYTALGHTEASYEDSLFLQHIEGGIRSVMRGKHSK